MERHDVVLPLRDFVVSFAKNAPSIDGGAVGGCQAKADGRRLSRENPQARKSARDHRSHCAPVSATADISAGGSRLV